MTRRGATTDSRTGSTARSGVVRPSPWLHRLLIGVVVGSCLAVAACSPDPDGATPHPENLSGHRVLQAGDVNRLYLVTRCAGHAVDGDLVRPHVLRIVECLEARQGAVEQPGPRLRWDSGGVDLPVGLGQP